MHPDDLGQGQSEAETPKRTREYSTIQFPYMDLDSAVGVTRAMRDRAGSTLFSKDQLAAALGHAISSGAFAAKLHAARMFGLIELTGGGVRVTQLGFDAVDPDAARAKAARVEAFLSIPLYRRTYEEYRGKALPARPHGLERVFIEFGVAPKRGGNARLAFDRSARQAGFYESGDDRLVAPLLTSHPDEAEKAEVTIDPEPKVKSDETLVHSHQHKLIQGLFQELPEARTRWTAAERARWLRLAASMFDVLYIADDKVVALIEVKTVPEDIGGKPNQTE
jgi:hypothetical protein